MHVLYRHVPRLAGPLGPQTWKNYGGIGGRQGPQGREGWSGGVPTVNGFWEMLSYWGMVKVCAGFFFCSRGIRGDAQIQILSTHNSS